MTSALIFKHRKINPSARITKHSTSKYANIPLYSSDTIVQLAIKDMPAYHSEYVLEYKFHFLLGLVLITASWILCLLGNKNPIKNIEKIQI